MLNIKHDVGSLEVSYRGKFVFEHNNDNPAIYLGVGQDTMDMYRGNFKIEDYLIQRIALNNFKIDENKITFYNQDKALLEVVFTEEEKQLSVSFDAKDPEFNRFWLRVPSFATEKVFGCGEQLSYLNLKGRNFPLWSSEPGVGRDKSTQVTWMADVKDKAGGDYYNTNYPQSTFLTSQQYFCHMDSTAYMDFNFKNNYFHELECWEIPKQVIFRVSDSYLGLVEEVTDFFGRQAPLPEWVYDGVILGLQGGTERVLDITEVAQKHDIKVAGIWAQDWQGKRITSFGKRLNWNWQWDTEMYPELDKKINNLKEKGIRFLGYINPYLIKDYPLYNEAFELGYFATDEKGEEYVVDFGEFYCGVVDFTNPDAFEWYKNRVIKKEMIDFGLDGWMADFGEYLPIDCKLSNGVSAKIMHNDWPRLWAKANYEAVQESNKLGDILYFMRAGFNGFQPYNVLLWGGDQCVDFSLHDGLASVIPAALSSGLSGMGLHHSDIGGYTSLHGLKRTKELFMRWADMAAFTPVMRTHEGNRPGDNFQFYDDEQTMKHLAKMVSIFVALKPYMQALVELNSAKGIPVQRPLFMHYENDEQCYDQQYQYLLGEDLLVAPVHQQNVTQWRVYLPKGDEWLHLPTSEKYSGGQFINVSADIGKPPVFSRVGSEYQALFESLF